VTYYGKLYNQVLVLVYVPTLSSKYSVNERTCQVQLKSHLFMPHNTPVLDFVQLLNKNEPHLIVYFISHSERMFFPRLPTVDSIIIVII